MSIYNELKNDHQKAKDILSRLADLSPRASASRKRLFEELKAMLTAHSRAEEKVFYDAIKGAKPTKDDALEGYEEHHLVDVLLREMSRLSPGDDQWKAKLTVLKENVEHHVKEEEDEIFDKAQEVLSADEADELGRRFVAERDKRLEKALA